MKISTTDSIISGLFLGTTLMLNGCTPKEQIEIRPNILWITCEDISPSLEIYGDKSAKTPTISQLAKEGVMYTNMFSCAGVCAPSRSSIITGMYPSSIGTHHMRTGRDIHGVSKGVYKKQRGLKDIKGKNVPEYSAVIPAEVKCFTEYLRKSGYYCTNNSKTDYQFAPPITAWDENSKKAHWRNRPKDKPFFSVFNIGVSHESQIWKRANKPLLVNKSDVKIPDYFPENGIVRNDVARNYSNITEMDKQVNRLIEELKQAGLYDNTIIFFFSDHGGPLPRGKREIYDSGIKVPFIVRFPDEKNGGTICSDLTSFVDLAPTMLSLAKVKIPDYMQGKAFLGEKKHQKKREYIFAGRDRLDEYYDMVRCVRDKRYIYVKNFMPDKPNYMDLKYRKNMPMMNELLRLNNLDKLNKKQKIWFKATKPSEELYDVIKDPYQLNNLSGKPEYKTIIKKYSNILETWLDNINDMGNIPEAEMVEKMWPGMIQPVTNKPVIINQENLITIRCKTNGASIAYQISDKNLPNYNWSNWQVYDKPFRVPSGKYIHSVAIRIGYKQSKSATTKTGS